MTNKLQTLLIAALFTLACTAPTWAQKHKAAQQDQKDLVEKKLPLRIL